MELFAPAHLGAQTGFALRTPVFKPPDDTRIDESDAASKSSADSAELSQNAENAAVLRETKEKADAYEDPDRPVGPTPSFDISVLEIEHDLKQAIAQIEAKRSHDGDSEAIKGEDSQPIPEKVKVEPPDTPSAVPIELVAPYSVEAQV